MCAAREKLLLLASSQQAIEPGLFRKEPDFIYIFFKEEKVNERLSSLRISYQPRMRRRPPCYQPCRTYIRYYVRLQKSERSYANTRKKDPVACRWISFFPTRDPVLSPLEIYGCCFGTVARFVVVPTATVAHPIRFQVMGGFAWHNNNNNNTQ